MAAGARTRLEMALRVKGAVTWRGMNPRSAASASSPWPHGAATAQAKCLSRSAVAPRPSWPGWAQPLPKGATVLVIESRGARAVDVIEWEDVLGDSPRIPGLHLLRR